MNLDTIVGALRAELRDALTDVDAACAEEADLQARLDDARARCAAGGALVSRLQAGIEALTGEPIDLDAIDTEHADQPEARSKPESSSDDPTTDFVASSEVEESEVTASELDPEPAKRTYRQGRPSTHAEVATIATEARAAGRSMRGAVAESFACSFIAADARIAAAREAGYDIGAGRSAPVTKHHEVEQVALESHKAGKSMRVAVAEHFGVTPDQATDLLTRARKAGRPIPRGNAVRRPADDPRNRKTTRTPTNERHQWTAADAAAVLEKGKTR